MTVTRYYDLASSGIMIFIAGVRPTMMILNGMLLRVQSHFVRETNCTGNPDEERGFCFTHYCSFHKTDLGPNDEGKLIRLMFQFTGYVTQSAITELDPESVEYVRNNVGRVLDYLVPKLRNGHLRVYESFFGNSPEENGVMVFEDVEDPEKPVFLYPVFGLRAVEHYDDGKVVRWKPGHQETY